MKYKIQELDNNRFRVCILLPRCYYGQEKEFWQTHNTYDSREVAELIIYDLKAKESDKTAKVLKEIEL